MYLQEYITFSPLGYTHMRPVFFTDGRPTHTQNEVMEGQKKGTQIRKWKVMRNGAWTHKFFRRRAVEGGKIFIYKLRVSVTKKWASTRGSDVTFRETQSCKSGQQEWIRGRGTIHRRSVFESRHYSEMVLIGRKKLHYPFTNIKESLTKTRKNKSSRHYLSFLQGGEMYIIIIIRNHCLSWFRERTFGWSGILATT